MSDQRHAPAKSDVDLEQELYKKRENIYVREVHGRWAFLRNLAGAILLGIYYGLPWLSWNGQQLVLFDLPARKFYLFGIILWPQDFFYLALLLIISALALFFFTALAGRLWCGYACPQTVWTDVFLWMERKIEGSRPARIKLDKSPMNLHKFSKKATKHLAWIVFSLFTGLTFVGYFTPIPVLWQEVMTNSLGPWETFWILFYGFATYGNAGWLREQVCIYMCPYSRFQSAMFDRDTLLIAYDEKRGEPRGGRKIGRDPAELGLGSCIDCKICVQVCPTGIDIRNGLQYQCIGCAACIDACDEVMDKLGYPRGLVRYTTENALEGQQTHIVRPRMLVYGALLTLITVAMFYSLFTRIPLEVDIIRDRNSLYVQTDEGLIENVYTLKIVNMKESDETYHLSIEGLEGAELINSAGDFTVPAGKVLEVPVRVKTDPVNLKSTSSKINFRLKSLTSDDLEVIEQGRFLGPRG